MARRLSRTRHRQLVALCAVAVSLICAHGAPAATFRIATFNARDLASGSRSPAQLEQMAQVLAPYDVVALQEVRDEGALEALAAALELRVGGCAILPRPAPSGESPELAFLWHTASLSLVDSGGVYPAADTLFHCDPHWAMFRAGAFDFALVNGYVPDEGTVAARRAEALALIDVWRWVQQELLGERDGIVLGSFGLDQRQIGVDALRRAGMPAMLRDPLGRPGVRAPSTRIDTTATVDNLWFGDGMAEWTGEFGVDAFDSTLFGGDAAAAMAAVSDHRPVWAAFTTDGPDDDDVPLSAPQPEVPAWPASEVTGCVEPTDLALADLDGDGRPELLVVDEASSSLVVHRNGTVQGFGAGVRYSLPGAPGDVAVADLDGDGDLDALVAAPRDSGMVVFRNEAGTLRQAGAFGLRAGPGAFALADLDGRPGAELARVDVAARCLTLLRFGPDLAPASWQEVELGAEPIAGGEAWAGDLDGDGDGDVVLVHPQPGSFPAVGYELITARGADGGASWTVARYPERGGGRDHLEVGEVNGDGVLDVIVASDLTAWIAATPGVFMGPHAETGEHITGDLCGADFDGDGLADAALVDWEGRTHVWASNGEGGFIALADLPFGDRLTQPSLACGDVDGDGDADIVAADATSGRIAVYHNPAERSAGTVPWADAGEGGWILGGSEVRLDGRRSGDADGDSLTFAWRQVAGPPVRLQAADTSTPIFVSPQTFDSLTFELRVADGQHLSAPDSVVLRVRPTEYPVRVQHSPQATWDAALHADAPFSAVAVSPVNPDRVYAGTYGQGVYCSRDGGATWGRSIAGIDTLADRGLGIPVNLCVLSLAAHPEHERVAFMGTEGSTFRTVDGGESWQRIIAAAAWDMTIAHHSLWVGMREGIGLWVSDDMGASFADANSNLPTNDYGAPAAVSCVVVDPFDPHVVYVVVYPWGGELCRTLDGQLWGRLDAPGGPLATSPHTGWLYVGLHPGHYAVLRSRDLGTTWDGLRIGLEDVGQVDDFAFDPVEPLVLWASTDRGVCWSGDGGMTWERPAGQPAAGAGPWPGVLSLTCQRPLALSGGRPQRLFVGADSALYRATLEPAPSTAVSESTGAPVPRGVHLLRPYPNPFNGAVVLAYETDGTAPAVLTVHDLLGQVVWRHEEAALRPGLRRVVWSGLTRQGRSAASGVYFVQLQAAGQRISRKLLLVR